jgi:hypothetical protein
MQHRSLVTVMAAYIVVVLGLSPVFASTFTGELSVGSSTDLFQVSGDTSVEVNITATGTRDPTLCPSCYSSYSDLFKVEFFDQAGNLLASTTANNYLYYSMYSSSNGIGAGPVGFAVPTGATTLELVSQLSIAGLLGSNGQPLNFGDLFISANGSIVAATPIPSTLPLLATAFGLLGLLGLYRMRKAANSVKVPEGTAPAT